MRKTFMLAAAIAAPLLLAAPVAHADPNNGYSERCSAPTVVGPGLTATTCVGQLWYNYGADYSYHSEVRVVNASSLTVSVRADQMIGPTTAIPGSTITLGPNSSGTAFSGSVTNPGRTSLWGRGYLSSLGWSTYTSSPSY